MRERLEKLQLNLGLKRRFVEHPVASALWSLCAPGRLRLPTVTLHEFLGAPPPDVPVRLLAPPPIHAPANDLAPLGALARAIDARRILEIGCHFGSSTLNLALACPAARLTTYDIRPTAGEFIATAEPSLRERIELRIASFPAEATRLRAEPRYDFIFIDGDHTLAAVLADSHLALDLIAPGGIIAWHDYCHRGHEWLYARNLVPEAVHTLTPQHPIRHLAGTHLAAFRVA